jgi:hypothetical protein
MNQGFDIIRLSTQDVNMTMRAPCAFALVLAALSATRFRKSLDWLRRTGPRRQATCAPVHSRFECEWYLSSRVRWRPSASHAP